jgi:ribosomal-protein-alanine N-acetyltransferase
MAREDVEAVADLEKQVPSPWNISLISSELDYASTLALVAEATGEVAGWCCCRHESPEAELLKVTVAAKWRRRSVATRLLISLENKLRAIGVESLYLEVRSKNVPATKFYDQAGFTVHGRRINYYSQPSDDALILQKLFHHH